MTDNEITQAAEMIAEKLEGTSKFLTIILEEHDLDGLDNNSIFCTRLDSLIFCCEYCDWWFEHSQMAENPEDKWICEECFNEG